ncbi:FUSC family protein [Pseudorhodoferax sp. Leaf274]|uniref:FUSC family protein n=1 Tax=Pseudorhodoferax sp. Leaf274 TaxID=1736318 RepID=UPI00070390A5|nr:FUSC family protein [Pseudorhodoferax sp. Leaf274]KQP37523.1 fusaric acid resistance protein [Pseudorhodoferax sp. Leaf274]
MTLRPALPRFTRGEFVFSLKSFGAAMLAMYCASRAGLPRPFWALLTAYVVANPLAGAVRSKAIYRFLGTLLGCTATLLLVPALSSAPELLTLALALWVGTCLFFSLLDRSPASYVFMLAGYTAALIGFPSVQTPQTLFDTATLRVEEIWIGIVCATLVHSIVLPQSLAPSVLGLLDNTLRDARRWLADLLRQDSQNSGQALELDRRRLAADITQLRLLSTHVPFDTTHFRWTAGAIGAMQDRVAALTPLLSAVEDRLQALEQDAGALPEDVTALLARIGTWLQAPHASPAALLRPDIDALADAPASDWQRALRIALACRLGELVESWAACTALRQEIDAGLQGAAPARHQAALGHRVLHRDVGMALWSGAAAVLVVCLCSAFWILTGWPSGSVATMMAAVLCCFFATMDDPAPAINAFLKYTLWSIPLSALYVLVLLPLVQDFGMLVLICAPAFLVLGCYMARPSTFLAAMAMLMGGLGGTLAMHDTGNADIVGFLNATLAQTLGAVAAARITGLMRSVGTDWSARRIQRAIWRELGEMAAAPRAPQDDGYTVRVLDRIGLLALRITTADGRKDATTNDALRDLRVGKDIVTLQQARAHLPTATTGQLLGAIAAFFGARSSGPAAPVPAALLPALDDTLQATLAAPRTGPEWHAAVAALVGLRRNLFPRAQPLAQGATP